MLIPVACSANYYGKTFSDDEIREFIIKGDITEFNRGICYQKFPIDPETPPPQEGSRNKTESRSATRGPFGDPQYNMQSTRQIQKPLTPAHTGPIYKCICPCPYSADSRGQTCGTNSAYFQYPDKQKPKCYREDVQDWEVNDYRSKYEIRGSANQPLQNNPTETNTDENTPPEK